MSGRSTETETVTNKQYILSVPKEDRSGLEEIDLGTVPTELSSVVNVSIRAARHPEDREAKAEKRDLKIYALERGSTVDEVTAADRVGSSIGERLRDNPDTIYQVRRLSG